jgi:hypothetical protein
MTLEMTAPKLQATEPNDRKVKEIIQRNRPTARQRLEAIYLAATVSVLVLLGFVWLGRSASEGALSLVKTLMSIDVMRIKGGIVLVFIIPAAVIAVGHHVHTQWNGFSAGLLLLSGIVMSLGSLFIALSAAACGYGIATMVAIIVGGYDFSQIGMPAILFAVAVLNWAICCVLVNIASVERKAIDPRWIG